MSKLLRSRLVVAILVAFAGSLWAQVAPPADLDSYVANSMRTFDVPGMAVAIVKDGKIVLAKGYGVRKLGDADAGRRAHDVRHRLEHKSIHHRRSRHVGGCGQALLGRSCLPTSAGLRDV